MLLLKGKFGLDLEQAGKRKVKIKYDIMRSVAITSEESAHGHARSMTPFRLRQKLCYSSGRVFRVSKFETAFGKG